MDVTATELEALHQTTKRLETRWELPLPIDPEFHIWDPLPWALFLDGVQIASEATDGRRFLDVGCGVGTKLAYMNYLGWHTSGIDHWSQYVDAARELCPFSSIVEADLFEVDHFDADLVYLYRPGRSDETQDAVEAHVAPRMRSGSLLFLACRMPSPDLPLARVAGDIWRRI